MRSIAKLRVLLAVTLIVVVMPQVPAWGDTTFVSGTIHSNTTWTPAGNPYLVIGGTRVDTNAVLTIQPGVLVKLNSDITFTVDGALIAEGTPSDSIYFTGNEGPFWTYLMFSGSSRDSLCVLRYCQITGAYYYGIICDGASPRIINNSIIGAGDGSGAYGGIRVVNESCPTISNNLIWGCGVHNTPGAGIYVGSGASPLITKNTIRRGTVAGAYAATGGGIYVCPSYPGPIIADNIIDSNSAYRSGGGIFIGYGSYPASILLSCNTIAFNSAYEWSGIFVAAGTANLGFFGNTINGNYLFARVNAAGLTFESSAIVNMEYNNFYGNSDLVHSVFEVYAGTGTGKINGKNNWWGTTNQSLIDLVIYDFWDDPSLREIDYVSFSTSFNSPPSDSIIVISPNGSEQYVPDSSTTIQWNPFCFTDSVKIEYSANGGGSWTPINLKTTNIGFYSWKIPLVSSSACRVRLSDAADGIPSDISDSNFTIRPPYIPGDANGDVTVDISDVVYLIAYIFSGGEPPNPLEAGDADCSGNVDISDVVYLIAYIFSGGSAPCA
jgi:hypothetical protein